MNLKAHGLFIAVLVVLLASLGATAVDASTRKVALGVTYYNPTDQSQGGYADLSLADAYKTNVGRYPAVWSVWSDWGGANADFPTALMNGIKADGMVPLVVWEPTNPANETCTDWSLDKIIDGSHDKYITDWATTAQTYGGRILLRFAHEMNGKWFIWGNGRCTNTSAKFRQAWQHVWTIFHNVGATNVKFVWSPFGSKQLKANYPGDAYVDYVGVSAFSWGPGSGHPWRSMVASFAPTMNALANMGNKKPVIGAEVGAAYVPSCSTCDKPAWIRTGYPAVYAKWPKVKAIVYFDINMHPIANQPDWRLVSPPAALAAYVAIAQTAKFQGIIP